MVRHLDAYRIESFLPTWESTNLWKNRQRVKVRQPLFPSYLFARIHSAQRLTVLGSPSVVSIIGNSHGPIPISDSEIDFLRSAFCMRRVAPYPGHVVGDDVLASRASIQGVQGALVRNDQRLRFVVTLDLIGQRAAIEVNSSELESVPS